MYNQIRDNSRKFFNHYIKNEVRKDKCAFCNSVVDLTVHHKEPLSTTIQKVLNHYNLKDVNILTHLVNSLSIQAGFLTLCENCHVDEHKVSNDYGRLSVIARQKNKLIREKEHSKKVEHILRNHYENGTVWLSCKDRDPLIEAINYRENSELKKSIGKLNGFLEKIKSNYRIEQFRIVKDINNKKKDFKSAWKIIKL